MLRVHWQGQTFNVTRLVLPRDRSVYSNILQSLADRHTLDVSDDRTDPRPGDFWVGCHPDRGWGHTDPDRVGWASFIEEPQAVHQFGVAAGRIETGALIEVSNGYKAAWALQPA